MLFFLEDVRRNFPSSTCLLNHFPYSLPDHLCIIGQTVQVTKVTLRSPKVNRLIEPRVQNESTNILCSCTASLNNYE